MCSEEPVRNIEVVNMLFDDMVARKPCPVDPVADHPFHFAPCRIIVAMPEFAAVPPYITTGEVTDQTLLYLLPVGHIVALVTTLGSGCNT